MTLPFEGVRVLEVASWTFVPGAGAALADLGADVIKVEPPAGDPQRGLMNMLALGRPARRQPVRRDPEPGQAQHHARPGHRPRPGLLLELAATADVFLTSYLPKVRQKLGIELDDLRGANPAIVYAAGSGWGPLGPMADTGGFDIASAWAAASMAYKMTPAWPRADVPARGVLRPAGLEHDRRGDRNSAVPSRAHRTDDRDRRLAAQRRACGRSAPT